MDSEYSPDWVIATLEDLRDFCLQADLKNSSSWLQGTLEVVMAEAAAKAKNKTLDESTEPPKVCAFLH